ncbi:hypothetical protein GJ744_006556 [Endocarpon pusillum]|uniref:Uncharacterized protein n=1 Tax=Endocarpon pusillum TaxID=364733 RepID=A0A8H7E987_9EURO|nr:hypothetical protein GJ744_006556 [Endocarpon pusillum]
MGVQKQWEGDDEDEGIAHPPPFNTSPPPSNIPRPPAGNFVDPPGLHFVLTDLTSGSGPTWPQQQAQQTQSRPNPWQGSPASDSTRELATIWTHAALRRTFGPSRPSGPRVPPLPYIPQLPLRPQGLRGPPGPQFPGTSEQPLRPVEWGAGPGEAARPGYYTTVEDLPGGVGFNGHAHFPGPRGHPRGRSGFAVRGAGAGAGGARRAARGGCDTSAGSGRGGRTGRSRQGSS